MRKKRVFIVIAVLCLIGIYIIRIYEVNSDEKFPERQMFDAGEWVPYGKDYNMSENDRCEGYYVRALETKVMETKEFCEKYDAVDMGLATHYYMVKLEVQNSDNEHVGEQGVALGMTMLIGTNYAIIPSPDMVRAANPDIPALSFSLQPGTKKEVWLVFSIIPGNVPNHEQIKEDPPLLQITQYPVQKLIKL